MSDVTYTDKTQTDPYDPAKWNADDANEVKNAVNSKVDEVAGKGLSTEDYTSAEKTKLAGIEANATENDTDANLKNRANHTGVQNADTIVDGTTNKVYTQTDKSKLAGIATGATANSTDAQLRDRSTHTGFQAISTVTNLQNTLNSKQDVLVSAVNIKTINGTSVLGSGDLTVAGGGGTVTSVNGDTGPTVVLDADDISDTSTTKKFTSTAEKTTWNAKQDALVSGTNIKTVNGTTILGSGDLVISGVTDGDKGDVVVASTGTVWTVPDLANKADLVAGEIPIEQLPESNLPEQIDDVTIKVNGSDKIEVNIDGVALVVVDGAITIDIAWLQAQIDASALPIPDALIDPTVDNVTRLFTCSPNPSEPEYDNAQWETSVNNGVSYTDNTGVNGQDPFDVGPGGKAIGQVKTRIKAVPGTNRAGVPVSNLTAFTAVGDDDLITGYIYLALDAFTGTPPLINTDNNYNIGTDGYGKGQPLRNIPVGGAVAFQYQTLSANTSLIIKDTPDTLDAGTVLEISMNSEGVVHVFDTRDSIDEDLPTQPTVGKFVAITHVSDQPANLSTWRISILDDAAGSFAELYGKNYTLSYVSDSVSLVQFNTIGGTSTVFKPQGLNLTSY